MVGEMSRKPTAMDKRMAADLRNIFFRFKKLNNWSNSNFSRRLIEVRQYSNLIE